MWTSTSPTAGASPRALSHPPLPNWPQVRRVRAEPQAVRTYACPSLERTLLGKALGAITSYAAARDVPDARVVFRDAAPLDAGFLPVTEIAGRVRVHGRGGTELQPGIDLLRRADDFPPGAPVLVITDGWRDVLRVRREHAHPIPQGARPPFTARGPVFRVR